MDPTTIQLTDALSSTKTPTTVTLATVLQTPTIMVFLRHFA